MKSWKRIALAAAVMAVLLASGCKANNTQQSELNGGPDSQGGQPPAMNGTQGVITAASVDSITIAVMPAGSMPQGGMGKPAGSEAPDMSGKPDGTPPRDGANAPQGNGVRPSATRDTSSWEKKTYAIDSSTKIVAMSFGKSTGSQSTALSAADLKVGVTVSIEKSTDGSDKADTITVMQDRGDRGPGGQGDPGAASTTTAPAN